MYILMDSLLEIIECFLYLQNVPYSQFHLILYPQRPFLELHINGMTQTIWAWFILLNITFLTFIHVVPFISSLLVCIAQWYYIQFIIKHGWPNS